MELYFYIAWLLILSQLVFSLMPLKNYSFALAKYDKKHKRYSPKVALIIPCKNLDENFEQNITSFYLQDYQNYILWFVVEDKTDPAYKSLINLKDKLICRANAADVNVLISGRGQECSQKIHNLLYACRHIPNDINVLAFADSDICVKPTWLYHLVYPLRHPETRGATTGYRWIIPKTNNLATLALSVINAKIAQLMGNTPFNHAWGGSMAIQVNTFKELEIEKLWQNAVSDDYSLSYAVKGAKKKVEYVPGCLVATPESANWSKFFEFGRRQFVITKVYAPMIWLFGLFSSIYAVFGLWGGIILAIFAFLTDSPHNLLFISVPILFFTVQLTRAILRQKMAAKLLKEYWPKLKIAAAADIIFFWLWNPLIIFLILSSACGNTIKWRGIRYKLISKTETEILAK